MHGFHREKRLFGLLLLSLLFLAACNLTSAPEQLDLTNVPTSTVLPTRTAITTDSAPTPVTVTSLPIPTQIAQRPTAILPATFIPFPTPSPLPVNIAILSPIPGSVVAGNVQVIGAATHPSFLQYQLEWGPDPNPGDLWFLAGGVVQNPVFNGLLGIWNTSSIQDGQYQLRLKVFLRDGTNLATVINGIRVQNRVPTIAPTATTIPRPIAAFSVDRASGQAPLVVRFFNQSSGNITSYSWDFGDGGSSSQASPTHTFRNPGIYNVTFRVTGPGGSSNVSRQISVQSAVPPVAGFTQNQTSGQAPLTVQFTDQSQGNITSRLWNFGDGTTSDAVSPSHRFDAVGTYNVILTVAGPGGSSSATRQITVQNPTIPEPIAALVPSQTEGEAPLTVQFDASDSSGQIDSYNWTFGDGTFGGGRIVTHTFTNPGLYEVILVVVGPGGQSERRVQINVVRPPDAPIASFEANPTSGDIPLTVSFNASGSTGPINRYRWDFGDNQTAEGPTVQHTFTQAGTYTVELRVEGPGGTDTEAIAISALEPIQPPVAAFNSMPSEGVAPLQVQFTNQSTGEELTFEWNFGDSSPVSTERDPLHTFSNPGTYTVTLRVTGPGGTNQAQGTVTALEPSAPPSAAFDAFPTSGEAPLTVTFDSTGDPGRIASYRWEFGDGNTSSTADPQHTYQQPGNYTARLTVTGSDGRESSSETQIAVSQAVVIAPPVAGFTANPPSATVGQPVQFTNTTTGDVTSFEWNFGDGAASTEANPQHVFNSPGDFTVSLRAVGPGGENTAQQTVSVVQPAQPPVAGFTANPPSATVGQPVQFTNTTTGDVTSFEWNFGDGAASTEANPQHVFNSPGDFTVSLRAVGPGGENTAQQTVSVADIEQPKQPGIVEELPILPDLEPQAVRNRLRAIFDNGAAQGRRAGVFSVIGDNMALQPGYLAPFADANLDTGSPDFDAIIDWYNQIDLGDGRTSFNRRSLAASSGWRVQDLLDPSRSDGASCNPGETPLECELRVSQAAVAIISIGMSDVGATDPATFRATMEQVLQIVLSRGVIPVVTTIQPNPNNADQVAAINETLVEAVQNVEASSNTAILIYNLWRAYTELPNNGLEGDGFTPTTAPNGPGVISSDVTGTYATNRRNRQTLNLLNRLHTQIFPDAAP